MGVFYKLIAVLAVLGFMSGCGVMWITIGKNKSSTTTTVEQIYVGGQFTTYNGISEPYIARLNSNGSLDTSFAPTGTGFETEVSALAFDSLGRLYAGGCFYHYNGTLVGSTARLNSNGSLDTSFLLTGGGFNSCSAALAFDSSGKIMVDDGFQTYNGTTVSYAARLNTDGTLDNSFLPTGTGLNNSANSLAIDSSGKIIVAGYFTSYNGTSEPYIARLSSTGSLDATFNPVGTGLNNTVNALAIDSSGKIIVGGAFTSYNGTSEPYIARLNANGSLDGTFAPTGTGLNSSVSTLAIDSSGKIVVGGLFTSYNGTNEFYVARLNTNGSLDTTFAQVGTGLSFGGFSVNGLAIESSGKIIVGGTIASYNGTSEPCIARLNSDGSLDTTFASTGTGFNNWPNVVAIRYVQE